MYALCFRLVPASPSHVLRQSCPRQARPGPRHTAGGCHCTPVTQISMQPLCPDVCVSQGPGLVWRPPWFGSGALWLESGCAFPG